MLCTDMSGSDVRRALALLREAASEVTNVMDEPEPRASFEDFGDNALIFDVYFWIQASADRDLRVIRSNIRFRIEELFREAGITIAFPQRDVHIDGSLQITSAADPGR